MAAQQEYGERGIKTDICKPVSKESQEACLAMLKESPHYSSAEGSCYANNIKDEKSGARWLFPVHWHCCHPQECPFLS